MLTKNELETNLARIHEWVKCADQKVSIFLTFQGLIITLLFTKVFSWTKANLMSLSYESLLFLILGNILIIISIYKSLSAIIPRISKNGENKSIIYFGDIAQYNLENFKKAIKKATSEHYEDELIAQIHISSKIATRKHSQFRDAIFMFFYGITSLALSFIIFKR